MLEPARVVTRSTAPVYRTVHQKVVLDPGGERWEWRWVDGKRVYCRVAVPPRYGTRPATVLVEPGRQWTEVVPARYGVTREKVLVRPESIQRYVVPPRYETVREWAVIEPERRVARILPPRYETREVTVKVREERQGWRQVHLRGSC